MRTVVAYPPKEVGEYSHVETHAWGLIPVRLIVSKRVEGWCVYILLKRMPIEYYAAYGDTLSGPTSWERVRDNGDKLPEKYARELFPNMEGFYIV